MNNVTAAAKAPAAKAPAKKAPAAKKAPTAKAPAKKAPAVKAPAEKAPAKKAPAKQFPAVSGVPHPATTWAAIIEAKGVPFTELERTAGRSLNSAYRVVKYGALPSAVTTLRFAEVTGEDADKLWAGVSAYALAEARASEKADAAKRK